MTGRGIVGIKAKWMVIIYVVLELFEGIFRSYDGIAHFAHLGGMLFGWLLILYWKKTNWREPGDLWLQIKSKLGFRQRLDSSKNDKYDNYHYQRRI